MVYTRQFLKLFSPVSIKSCTFPNRIMSTAAVTRLAAEDGHITDALKERYKRMAQGGLGAMVVEAAVVLPSKSSFNLRVSDDQFVPELREFVDNIHTVNPDVKIGLQLIHFLKVARSGWRQKVEDLKPKDIQLIPGQFADGALRAKAAGFDFVELHMAHFTTLASFLSLINKRKDEYGCDFEGRVKLPTEVILTVRDAVGSSFPVGVRINGEEFTKEGNTILQSARVAQRLSMIGIDYISVSAGERFEDAEPPQPNFPPFAGTGYSGYRMSPRWWNPDGVQVYLAEGVRRAVREAGFDTPIVTAGKIRTSELAEEILEQGKADIIGMVRAILCDPDWPNKAREGRADDIVKCSACGYCSEADERYETITCIQWPKGALNAPSPWLLIPPCKAACPAGIDIRGYIELITQGHYEKALSLIKEKIPFPATISRVCPRPCEAKCNRNNLDEAVAINALKRFVVDAVSSRLGRGKIIPPVRTREERVAIVGSGPAGLTAAFELAKLGYGVTIFEALSVPGGMLAAVIPEYRLPKHLLQNEIEDIQKAGVEIRLNTPIGNNGLTMDVLWQRSLLPQGYKVIFIATGAHKSLKLGIPGEDMQGVYQGITFLKNVNLGKSVIIGEKVAIIGGGNVAIDSGRTALRLGSKEVFIIYRRSPEEMPAHREEVTAAEAEGIKIHYLANPARLIGSDGKVKGVECLRTELGEPDERGRRRPVPIKDSEFVTDADMVISAIGEVPDLSFLDPNKFKLTPNGTIGVNPNTLSTSLPGIFAGGDVASGPSTVIEAIAAGRKAAISIDKYLRGQSLEYEELMPNTINIEDIDTASIRKRKRQKMPYLSLRKRKQSFKEVELGLTDMQALGEADRCLQCGMFPKK
jgi:NADPH-dependent glutamate synthase beta subunit-like oxidoreductase/2,4-dienoyl-CoA reductase-like NADH-dependent reductase (Old Yellow Enzyme family)